MRWADMDQLGHVNNVAYLDYLQEARIEMFTAHRAFSAREEHTEGVLLVRYQVDFHAPLVFRRQPILVDLWVTDIRAASFTLAYEIYDIVDGERVVHLRATSQMAPFVFATERPRRLTEDERTFLSGFLEEAPVRAPIGGPRPADAATTPLRVRFSDLDVFRHANNVKYFEYFQESRIQYLMGLHTKGQKWTAHVVARTDIDYRRPIHFRRAAYDVHNWISHVGNRSFTISSDICDGDELLATAHVVMVTFDAETQRSAEMPADQKRALTAEMGRQISS